MAKIITVIPAVSHTTDTIRGHKQQKKRVCAYCRLGSGDIYGINRELNERYYEWYITSKIEWSFTGVFFDEGAAGRNRNGFRYMLSECRKGNIDIIVTKSVSRFARNLRECLDYIRELRDMGVTVIFELERICTTNARSDAILTGLFSADDESQSVPRNQSNDTKEGKKHDG